MIRVSKELIEKYHLEECTPEERKAVEDWLLSDDTGEELQVPFWESKTAHKAEIWDGIKSIFPEEEWNSSKPALAVASIIPFWKKAIAAAVTLGVLTIGSYHILHQNQPVAEELISVNNTSLLNVKHVDSKGYNIAIGPKTIAKINYQTGIIDFSGSILISPNQDIELRFIGAEGKMELKMGQTYIVLNDKSGNDRVIFVSRRNLMDLPPLLQKQITAQFDI